MTLIEAGTKSLRQFYTQLSDILHVYARNATNIDLQSPLHAIGSNNYECLSTLERQQQFLQLISHTNTIYILAIENKVLN